MKRATLLREVPNVVRSKPQGIRLLPRIISLRELLMDRFDPSLLRRLVMAVREGAKIRMGAQAAIFFEGTEAASAFAKEGFAPETKELFRTLATELRENGFVGSALIADRLACSEPERDFELLSDLGKQVELELELVLLVRVRSDLAWCFDQPALFGDSVGSRFPATQYDASEAGNCRALGLHTATVFHLMRVMEVLLKAVAADLDIPDPVKEADRNWGAILRNVRKRLDGLTAEGKPEWKSRVPFYEEVYAHLSAVKIAWRNPVMHVEAKHDEHDARRILDAVRGFAEHLASGLGSAT